VRQWNLHRGQQLGTNRKSLVAQILQGYSPAQAVLQGGAEIDPQPKPNLEHPGAWMPMGMGKSQIKLISLHPGSIAGAISFAK
jgi:hypothetical protein